MLDPVQPLEYETGLLLCSPPTSHVILLKLAQ